MRMALGARAAVSRHSCVTETLVLALPAAPSGVAGSLVGRAGARGARPRQRPCAGSGCRRDQRRGVLAFSFGVRVASALALRRCLLLSLWTQRPAPGRRRHGSTAGLADTPRGLRARRGRNRDRRRAARRRRPDAAQLRQAAVRRSRLSARLSSDDADRASLGAVSRRPRREGTSTRAPSRRSTPSGGRTTLAPRS